MRAAVLIACGGGALRVATGVSRADTVLLLNLYERELIDWFAATLSIALAPARPRDAPLPRIIDTAYISAMHNLSWAVFENYIAPNDRRARTRLHASRTCAAPARACLTLCLDACCADRVALARKDGVCC